MKEILRIDNLGFSYSTKEVFHDISLSISAGEILCLMGPNGCGKTTLIDSVMAIHKPNQGKIYLMGQPISDYKRKQIAQNIAYVPQIHNITFPYSVREVVMMGRSAHIGPFGQPTASDEFECLEALKKVGISHLSDKPYSRLSGGEVKLVLLARALSQRTPLIIMDEPTAYLDFKNELIFLETIAELCNKEKIAVLMATHSPDHAFYFSSKGLFVQGALMSDGCMYSYGNVNRVITEENIEKVYGVNTRICPVISEGENMIKSVTLLSTIKS